MTRSHEDGSSALPEGQGRPMKRIKFSTETIDTVALIAEIGVSKFDQGDHTEAEAFFSLALRRNEGDLSFFHLPATDVNSSSSRSIGISRPVREKLLIVKYQTKVHHMLTSQRHEYNEGMHMYNNPLLLQESDDRDRTSSMLLYNIALTYVHRGQIATATEWLMQSLERIGSRLSDNERIAEFAIMVNHNLGHCFYRVGDREKSLQYYQEALMIATKHDELPPTHLAIASNCVGVLYCYKQETEKATKLLEKSLVLTKCYYGVHSSQAATIWNNMGSAYYLCSNFGKALTSYKASLNIRIESLGKDSIEVAATIFNLGLTYHRVGSNEKALEHYREFIDIARTKMGLESRDVAIAYMRMGEILSNRGELNQAMVHYLQSLKSSRIAMGPFHPEVASVLNRLGNLCCEMNDLEAAMHFYQDGLKVEKTIWGMTSHPHIIITVTNIAHIYKHQGNSAAALRNFALVRKMQFESLGPNHIDLAETLSSIGLMLYRLNRYEKSFESYQEALRIRRDHFETDENLDVASTLNSVGLVAFKLGLLDMAKSCISRSLSILKMCAGKDSRDVAVLWYNIATIYFETGESEDVALKCYKETLRIERIHLGQKHPDVVLTLLHLGQKHQKIGGLDEALEYFAEALSIERNKRAENNVAVGKILNLIGNVHLQQGDVKRMMKCYIEASRIYEASPESGESLVIAGYNFYGLSKTHPSCAPVA